MFLKQKWSLIASIAILSSSILTGCTPTNFIEKGKKQEGNQELNEDSNEVSKKTEKIDETKIEEAESGSEFDGIANEFEMTDTQKESLEKSESKSSDEAAIQNILDERVVVKKNVPAIKESFNSSDEASQFFSYALFMYYSINWDGPTFYKTIKPYLHKEFLDMLPSLEEDRIKMYKSLQRLFKEQLDSTIEEYEMTKLYDGDSEEDKVFFRKYILSNKEEIFYKTTIKKSENGTWQLVNDEPSAGYHTGKGEFKPAFIEKKEND